ncbi:hypothetical protein [Streptomyces sp. NBC_00102]|uniref:hypothetical protein n=1 Tax=Streptomyces sp. NBC_00102 TaxID=2975652 RepID=UPI00225BFFDA|nr:hypothetical protein [Streptomyces sp. NBC_00102]MCX5399148.1 hypothetical protein [Streptomyces sp. NBC_00102]
MTTDPAASPGSPASSGSPASLAGMAGSGRLAALLDRATTGPDDQAWSDLWTELFHNGTLDVSDPLVMTALSDMAGGDMARGDDAGTAAAALHLAGALLVQADQRWETRDLRQRRASEVARMVAAAGRLRRTTTDRNDYCYLLEALLGLEGDIHWAEDLFWGIVNEEYELDCPDPECCAPVWVVVGERGFFSTAQDYALSDDVETLPLRPAAPDALDGLGRRLHGMALADGHAEVADALTYAFGEAVCPSCERRFPVAGQIAARTG